MFAEQTAFEHDSNILRDQISDGSLPLCPEGERVSISDPHGCGMSPFGGEKVQTASFFRSIFHGIFSMNRIGDTFQFTAAVKNIFRLAVFYLFE